MKKLLKILGITLATLVGVVVVAVGVTLYVIFTPNRLSAVADKVAREYIDADYCLGDVELTFFSTFPEFGLKVDGLLVLNPTEGAQSDTLLAAKKLVARIELEQLLREGCINVHELVLQGLHANLFIAEDGTNNFDILRLPEDTVPDEDSTSFIRAIAIEDLRLGLEANQLTFVDLRDTISAALYDVDIDFRGEKTSDSLIAGKLQVQFPRLSADYKGVSYASDADIRLLLPYEANLQWTDSALGLDKAHIAFTDEAEVAVNQFQLTLTGWADVLPEIAMDVRLRTNTWNIEQVLRLVPDELFTMPEGITANGNVRLVAHAKGLYNEHSLPNIWARVSLDNGTGAYAELPYTAENVSADAEVIFNKNTNTANAKIAALHADVLSSSVDVAGEVNDILNNVLLDLNVNAHLNLPDVAYFLPKNLTAKGKADGEISLHMTLDDLKALDLTKGTVNGDIRIGQLVATMDSMTVDAPKANLAFTIPNTTKVNKSDKRAAAHRGHLGLLSGTLHLPSGLTFGMADGTAARLNDSRIGIQLGNILKEDILYADVSLHSSEAQGFTIMQDSLGNTQEAEALLTKPDVKAYVEYDLKDSLRVPTLSCDFAFEHLQSRYDTITMDVLMPNGTASIRPTKHDKSLPAVHLTLHLDELKSRIGSALDVSTGKLGANLRAQRSHNKENVLLEWNPRLDFDIKRVAATPNVSIFPETVRIPEITFAYSNKVFDIDTARVELGNSNLNLSGTVSNIGPWLENTGLLTGTLNLTSSMTDVDQLLTYTSGIGSSEDEQDAEPVEAVNGKEPDPYIVPKGTDLVINTHIAEAKALGERVRNLTGRLHVNDGILVLEQMGFICKAARLELTAMYKTPRKNHLYAGLDYHMYDINVAELVNLIPQVDTLLPMLRALKGNAEFHLAAETYLNGFYEIKPSTTRGACSISGKDRTGLDNETFSKVAKLLTFKKSTENKIDSISAEITLFRKEVDVYPFLLTMDKWMAAMGGQYRPYEKEQMHNYHVSLLNPLYLGVDIITDKKNPDKLQIKLAKCRYAQDFKPAYTKVVETQAMDLRKLIREALTKQDNE